MLNKTLEKKLKELEAKIENFGEEICAENIIRYELAKDDFGYEKTKKNLEKRGFKNIRTEDRNNKVYFPFWNIIEIWEKNIGTIKY